MYVFCVFKLYKKVNRKDQGMPQSQNAANPNGIKLYLREGNANNYCNVHILALEIITPLNECTGRLFKVPFQVFHSAQTQQARDAKKLIERSGYATITNRCQP